MNYQESISYLNFLSLTKIRLGLENTSRILQHFGNPQEKVESVHVAGTNGKGSTCAFVESILSSSGYKTGLYTSPHLLDFRERIRIGKKMISKERFAELATSVRRAIEFLRVPATYFEFGTIMAFIYFWEEGVDWSVIEVGLGGRLDATNLCNSRISIITSISLDHEKYLGSDLRQIAYEKASIIREKGMVVADSQVRVVSDCVQDMADRRGAALLWFGKDFNVERTLVGSKAHYIDFTNMEVQLLKVFIPLIGSYQIHNAGLAVAACLSLDPEAGQVTNSSIRKGLEIVEWPGRMELVESSPIILLDGAHNVDSAKKLTESLREDFDYERCLMIIAIFEDKAVEKIADILSEVADLFILSGLESQRSINLDLLSGIFEKYDKPIETIDEIPYAISLAKKMADPGDLICITGSLLTVAEAKRFFSDDSLC